MAFTVPTFNLTVNIWRGPTAVPPVGAPALTTTGNLTPGRRALNGSGPAPGQEETMFLLLPAGTDIRSNICVGEVGDSVEAPAGSGRIYFVHFVDDVAKGFANEYRFAILAQSKYWPKPIP